MEINYLNSEDDVLYNFIPFIKVYKDGRVERYILTESVPAGPDPISGGECKDVTISEDPEISARIFVPKAGGPDPGEKLPLIVHYHGGGYCTGSAFGAIIKYALSQFACNANAVIMSVNYRLAPETPLPAAYDDGWAGMKWAAAHASGDGPEPWLNEHVDFSRVFVGGESSGGNLAMDVMLRATSEPPEGIKIVGLFLIHPYFLVGKDVDPIMQYLYPGCSGRNDHPRLNPLIDYRFRDMACERVLVAVAEKDILRNRCLAFYEGVLRSGWPGKAEFIYDEGEHHCFHLFSPSSPNFKPFVQKLSSFITGETNYD